MGSVLVRAVRAGAWVLVAAAAANAQQGPLDTVSMGTSADGRPGLLRTPSAFLDRGGRMVASLSADGAREAGLLVPQGTTTILDGWIGARFSITDGIALSASLAGAAAEDTASEHNALAVGRSNIGVAFAWQPVQGLSTATLADLLVLPPVGGVGVGGIGVRVGLAAGYDFFALARVPVRLHASLAFDVDDLEAYRAADFDALARAAHRAYDFKRLAGSVAGEFYLPFLDAFVEYHQELIALGSALTPAKLGGVLTPGVRWSPGPRVALEAAADVALLRDVTAAGLPALPFLRFYLRLLYAFDIFGAPPPPMALGAVDGRVVDAATGGPVAGAVVKLVDADAGLGALASEGPEGRFRAERVPPGTYGVAVERDGYKPARTQVTVEADARAALEVKLEPAPPPPPPALLKGRLVDLDGRPVEGTMKVSSEGGAGAGDRALQGTYELQMPPGKYHTEVRVPGYLVQGRSFELKPGGLECFDFLMRPVPAAPVAVLEERRIAIKQTIHFEFDKAEIKPESFPILDEVASLMLLHPEFKLVEVQGHTDDVGGPAYNARLSQDRAFAVVDYLGTRGVRTERLRPVGYGRSKPLVKAATDEARARNRRVEFVILKKE